jgi:PAS domain-containing protein
MKPLEELADRLHQLDLVVRLLFEELSDAVIVIGGDGLIKMVNRRAELMFGRMRAELYGRTLATLMLYARAIYASNGHWFSS